MTDSALTISDLDGLFFRSSSLEATCQLAHPMETAMVYALRANASPATRTEARSAATSIILPADIQQGDQVHICEETSWTQRKTYRS